MKKRRLIFAMLAVMVLIVGVLSRTIETDSSLLNKYLGDTLYAVIFYVTLGFVFPDKSVGWRSVSIAIFVVAVECFQLTGIPLQLRQGNSLSKLVSIVLGTKFSWYDMLAYFVGILAIGSLDLSWICNSNQTR